MGSGLQIFGAEQKSPSNGVLRKPWRKKEPDLLCLEEMGAFWRKGHLLTVRIKTRRILQ